MKCLNCAFYGDCVYEGFKRELNGCCPDYIQPLDFERDKQQEMELLEEMNEN